MQQNFSLYNLNLELSPEFFSSLPKSSVFDTLFELPPENWDCFVGDTTLNLPLLNSGVDLFTSAIPNGLIPVVLVSGVVPSALAQDDVEGVSNWAVRGIFDGCFSHNADLHL